MEKEKNIMIDELLFEGEYLNGEGKDYDKDGKLDFFGEYKNDKRWNGKENIYNFMGNLSRVRKYLNGIKK